MENPYPNLSEKIIKDYLNDLMVHKESKITMMVWGTEEQMKKFWKDFNSRIRAEALKINIDGSRL